MKFKALIILFFGLSQMCWELLGVNYLARLFMHTAASPAPKVFTAYDGIEVFSAEFFLKLQNEELVKITPELYSRLHGPFARRNTYGSTITYAPYINESNQLYRNLDFAFCEPGPLTAEMNLGSAPSALVVKTRDGKDYVLELC